MKAPYTILLFALLFVSATAHMFAGGPLGASGTTSRKYASGSFPLTYRVDQGTLGSFSNATATAIVVYSFWEWDSIASAAMSFTNGTQLGRDVTLTTDAYISGTGQWGDGINPIVFDHDGSITDARLGVGAKNSVLGFAGSAWTGTTFTEGYAIINGFLSGSGTTNDEDRYKATITHEIGHFLGLSHSQVTLHADFATMYPMIAKTAQRNISPDDTAAMAWMYPATGYAATVGSISGTVRNAGGTNLSGVVVLAVDSATGATYSTVVDYYSGNNTTAFTNQPTANGGYTISGLPPGRYYVRIEPPKSNFSSGSSLASYSTPQNTTINREWYNGVSESGDMLLDDQNQKVAVTVSANTSTSGINVTANESATLSTVTYHNATVSNSWPLPFATYTGYAVRFTAPSAGSLLGVVVRTEYGSTMPLTGTLTVTVHANAAGSIAGIPGTVLGSVTIPFKDLSSNQDNEIWLRGIGTAINFANATDFHVALTTNGVGALSLRSDNGAVTQNRTSYYTSANGWRNMPSGMAGGTPGYNLAMSAIYTTSLAGNPTPAIALTPTSIDFGRARPNTTVDRTITVSNPGTAALSVSAASITGTDASAFTIVSGGAPFVVAQAGTHQMTVRFTSRRGGIASKSASLSLTSDAPTSPSAATLAGLVVDPIANELMPTMAFGARRMDSVHASNYTVLRNTGNDTLNISSLALSGADAGTGLRILSSTAATRLAPDSTLTVRMQFSPIARRAYNATLTISHDDSLATSAYPITATGIAPLIATSSDSLSGGNIRVQTNATAEVWLRNAGNAPMSLNGFTFVGADSSVFQVIAPASLPATIAAGDSIVVRVRFAPTARRGYQAVMRANTDAIPATTNFTLTGRGIAPVIAGPTLAVVGATPVGSSIDEPAVAIRNLGDAPLTISALAISGVHAGDFSVAGPALPAIIAPGDSLQVRIRMEPNAAGTRSADLVVTSDDPFVPSLTVAMIGSGQQGQLVVTSNQPLDFGDVTIATSTDRVVRFTNNGSAPLMVSSISATGSSTFALQAPALPMTIAPGDTAQLPVRFLPTIAGMANARITFASNGVDAVVTYDLIGRGVAPGLALTRSSLAFGSVPANQSRIDSFSIRNTGALALTDVSVSLNGAAASAFDIMSPTGSFTIEPGAQRVVVVRLTSQVVARALEASVRVTATGGAMSDVTLSATIVESMLATVPAVDFGLRGANTSNDTTVTLRNTGTTSLRIDSISVDGEKDGSRGQFFVASIAAPAAIAPGDSIEIRLRFSPFAGAGAYAGVLTVYTDNPPDSAYAIALAGVAEAPSGVHDPVTGTGALQVSAIHPNPARTSAWLTLRAPASTHVKITIADMKGRVIAVAFDGEAVGEDHVLIDASTLQSGEYIVMARSADNVATRRLVVVR